MSSSIVGCAPPRDLELRDVGPARRDARGIVGLDLGRRNARDAVGVARRFGDLAAGRLPWPVDVQRAFAELLVDFEEGPAGVFRVHLHVAEFVRVELVHDADAEFADAFAPWRVVVALRDHHVAAGAAAAFEVASAGGAFARRRDDLDELVADRQQRIDETEVGDPGVAKTHVDTEQRAQVVDGGFEFGCYECNLPQAQPHVRLPPNSAGSGVYAMAKRLAIE